MRLGLGLVKLGLCGLCVVAALHLLRLARWALLQPRLGSAEPAPIPPASAPRVTVQLPMRNERYVARRAILAACALDWPRDRLELQVLDDSDDETRELVDETVAEQAALGFAIRAVRRRERRGYKAGHLDYALGEASGELIAVLDADFVPPPDFLQRLVPRLLAAPDLAFVQGRWAFLNGRASLLTRCQALILEGLMAVEQAYLSAQRRPLQFNGTGGIFRKEALVAAGGWMGGSEAASVTEDLDLSYRAHLHGYRGEQHPEVAVPTELPAAMAAFRAQQKRWVRGSGEVLRRLLAQLESGTLRPDERRTMLAHLLRHARQPCLAFSLVVMPLGALLQLSPLLVPGWALPAAVTLLLLALGSYLGAARLRIGESVLEAVLLSPVVLALSLGLAPALAAAVLKGALEAAPGEFVRTPKTGGETASPGSYRAVGDRLAGLEVGLGACYAVWGGLALLVGHLGSFIGYGLLCGGGLLWVGLGSLRKSR